MSRPGLVHELEVQLADESERYREIVFADALRSVVQRLDVVEDVVDVLRYVGSRPDLRLYRVHHRRHRAFDLARRRRVLPQVHEEEEVGIGKQLRDAVKLAQQARCLVAFLRDSRSEIETAVRRELVRNESVEPRRLPDQFSYFDFLDVCRHDFFYVHKWYWFVCKFQAMHTNRRKRR